MPKQKKKTARELLHPPFPPSPRPKLAGTIYGIGGIIIALLGMFFLPLIMGIVAVWCGVKAWRLHTNKVGTVAILLGLLMAVLGSIRIIASFTELGLV
ncbi:MAG: hypothetical protein Q7R76_03725 [Candidatus Woesearchaeota archaeon]|nr:hypothetical protein [Candidatus Woesearchaeota archaeon]